MRHYRCRGPVSPSNSIEQFPKSGPGWYCRGVALGLLARYDAVLDACVKANRFDPDYASAWYNKGVAVGRLAEDIESLEVSDHHSVA